jgi:hypothetical protein
VSPTLYSSPVPFSISGEFPNITIVAQAETLTASRTVVQIASFFS